MNDVAHKLLAESAALFRQYEAHHRAKSSEAGRPEKAEVNADIAKRIEAFLEAAAQPNPLEAVERLEALARAATPGQWGVEDPMDHCLTIVSNPSEPVYDWKWVATCDWPDEDDHLITSREVKANAAFIAAANPETILALISTLRSQAEALERAVEVAKSFVLWAENPSDDACGMARELEWLDAARALIARAALTPEVFK